MRALITGGAGCIGSDLAEALVRRGDEVWVIDNLSSGRLSHIEPLMRVPNFRFTEGDVLDFDTVHAVMAGADVVFHLAANPDVKYSPGDPTDKDLKQNLLATHQVLESMRLRGVKRLVFSSTSAVYGIAETLPIPEHLVPRPISLYGASKLACEAFIGSFQHLFGMQCLILRFANVVGPKSRAKGSTVISDFIQRLRQDPTRLKILGNGKQAKSYLLASECVEAMLFALEHAPGPLSIYNLGCSDWLPVNRIADMVVREMGLSQVKYEHTGTEGGWPGDVPRFLLDVSAINRLGWKARHNSEEAVVLAIRAALERDRENLCRP